MADTKNRTEQQIMEAESLSFIERLLPREWVVHQYSPDCGIDFVIELFDRARPDAALCTSLGEVVFAQAKSVRRAEPKEHTVPMRFNVARRAAVSAGEPSGASKTLNVIAFSLDVALLETVRAMGAAVPVLLLMVSLDDEALYFLCLNDYIDKILIPEHEKWREQETVTIYIPESNKITERGVGFEPFRIYSQRAKLYAAFNVFSYQLHELQQRYEPSMAKYFLDIIMQYDFWGKLITFGAIRDCSEMPVALKKEIDEGLRLDSREGKQAIVVTWSTLANLGRMQEDVWRETFLPSYLGISLT